MCFALKFIRKISPNSVASAHLLRSQSVSSQEKEDRNECHILLIFVFFISVFFRQHIAGSSAWVGLNLNLTYDVLYYIRWMLWRKVERDDGFL